MFIVASTLLDLIKNLRAFAGLMVVRISQIFLSDHTLHEDPSLPIDLSTQVLYYSYAVLGMELFGGAITYEDVKNMTNK